MSYSVMAWLPVLAIVKLMKIAENSTDYSINNTARHVLWLPVSAEDKYKGKPTIDSLFARVGDGLAALTVLVGVQLLALSNSQFFAFTVALVVLWLALATVVVREHRALAAPPPAAGQ
jgi:AAA family ATP:ADP antiporter